MTDRGDGCDGPGYLPLSSELSRHNLPGHPDRQTAGLSCRDMPNPLRSKVRVTSGAAGARQLRPLIAGGLFFVFPFSSAEAAGPGRKETSTQGRLAPDRLQHRVSLPAAEATAPTREAGEQPSCRLHTHIQYIQHMHVVKTYSPEDVQRAKRWMRTSR